MGRPPAGTHDTATPERLLAAAEAEFARCGLAGARLEDIARRAGIRRPSLLYHFPTKGSLYAAVVRRTFARMGEALVAAMIAPGTFAQRIDRTVGAFAGFLDRNPSWSPVLLREFLDRRGPGRRILLQEIAPLLGQVERFVRDEGGRELRAGLPVRAAILHVVSDILLRSAAGPLRRPLWGPANPRALARILFVRR